MKQIIHLDKQLEEKLILFEEKCEVICRKLEQNVQAEFEHHNHRIVIELVRLNKGKIVSDIDVFEDDYESFIELGLEQNEEYYPNGYIPLWKCKTEWFQKIGYMTNRSLDEIEKIILLIVNEILEDVEGD